MNNRGYPQIFRTVGTTLPYKDVLKQDLKTCGIAPGGFESLAADCSGWHHTRKSAITTAVQKREEQWEVKRAWKCQRAKTETAPSDDHILTGSHCNSVSRSKISLYNHSRRYGSTIDWARHLRAKLYCPARQMDANNK